MLPIYLCDDQPAQLTFYKKAIERFILIENWDMEIAYSASSPQDLLCFLDKNPKSGLYILDVELNAAINGVQLAETIRRIDPRGFIIFLTTNEGMTGLIFKLKVEALDYIIKGDRDTTLSRLKDSLLNVLEKYSSPYNQTHQILPLKLHDRVVYQDLSDIILIKTSSTKHKLMLQTKDTMLEFTASLLEIKPSLTEDFIYCSKSCIINKTHIVRLDQEERTIILEPGICCPVSVRIMALLKKELPKDML